MRRTLKKIKPSCVRTYLIIRFLSVSLLRPHIFALFTAMLIFLAQSSYLLAQHPRVPIVIWDFEEQNLSSIIGDGDIQAGLGIGMEILDAEAQASEDNTQTNAIALNQWSTQSLNPDDYLKFKISTLGFQRISLSFDEKQLESGLETVEFQGSIDGESFFPLTSAVSLSTSGNWKHHEFNFSNLTELDNQPEVTFRIYGYDAYDDQNLWLIDNVIFEGEEYVESFLLTDFYAISNHTHILISWHKISDSAPPSTLATTVGFNLYRGTDSETPSAPLNSEVIPVIEEDGENPILYEWEDDDVEIGTSYIYWLEELYSNGSRALHGPVFILYQSPTAVTLGQIGNKSSQMIGFMELSGVLFLISMSIWLKRRR